MTVGWLGKNYLSRIVKSKKNENNFRNPPGFAFVLFKKGEDAQAAVQSNDFRKLILLMRCFFRFRWKVKA